MVSFEDKMFLSCYELQSLYSFIYVDGPPKKLKFSLLLCACVSFWSCFSPFRIEGFYEV